MPGPLIFMCGVCLGALITIAAIFVTLWRERLISKARIRNAYEKGVAQANKNFDWIVGELDELWYEVEELQKHIENLTAPKYEGLYADGKPIRKEHTNEL